MAGGGWQRVAIGAACAGALATLTACSGSSAADATTPSPAAAIAMMPNANPFTSALSFTNGLGTAKATVDSTTTVDGTTTDRRVTGTIVFDPGGYGMVTVSASGTTVQELGNTSNLFLRPDATSLWTKRPGAARSDASWLITPLTGLGDLADVVDEGPVGPAVPDGAATHQFSGTLAATPDRLRALGLTEADIAVVGDAWSDVPITVTAWVDPRNRIVQVDRAFSATGADGKPVSARTSTTLSGFAGGLDLSDPPPQSIGATLPSAGASSSSSS